ERPESPWGTCSIPRPATFREAACAQPAAPGCASSFAHTSNPENTIDEQAVDLAISSKKSSGALTLCVRLEAEVLIKLLGEREVSCRHESLNLYCRQIAHELASPEWVGSSSVLCLPRMAAIGPKWTCRSSHKMSAFGEERTLSFMSTRPNTNPQIE